MNAKPSRKEFVQYIVWQHNNYVWKMWFEGVEVDVLFEYKHGYFWPQGIFHHEAFLNVQPYLFDSKHLCKGVNHNFGSLIPDVDYYKNSIKVMTCKLAGCQTLMVCHWFKHTMINRTDYTPILYRLTPELAEKLDWKEFCRRNNMQLPIPVKTKNRRHRQFERIFLPNSIFNNGR